MKFMKITAVNKGATTVINYINFILSIMEQSIMKCASLQKCICKVSMKCTTNDQKGQATLPGMVP